MASVGAMHCGLCAEVCPFYVQTGDPKYTPIWKLEPFKQAYKREAGPLSFFFKLFNLKHKVTVEELEEWLEDEDEDEDDEDDDDEDDDDDDDDDDD